MYEELKKIINDSENIVFFGGAGVSTASNIPDFRSSDGLYNQKLGKHFTPEQLVSHTYFMRYTEDFFDFYRKNLIHPEAKPNKCHIALAELERRGKLRAIVTQNVDGLHQAAGSKIVYELHGTVHKNHCMDCGEFYTADAVIQADGIPRCTKCGGIIKPDVVLYEEGLDDATLTGALMAISKADTLIIGGTTLIVYPAAGLINYFNGSKMVLINKSSTPADEKCDLIINASIDEVMYEAVFG